MSSKNKIIIAGIGCRRGITKADIATAIEKVCPKNQKISYIATSSIKADETGLLQYVIENKIKILFLTKEELNSIKNLKSSEQAKKYLDINNVCEAAVICAGAKLIRNKTIYDRKITIALGEKENPSNSLSVVGISSGEERLITQEAKEKILSSDLIVGYKNYISLLPKSWLKNKEIISTGMGKEKERCEKAISEAYKGKNVCVISSGDAGIYGMAGLIFELTENENLPFNINLIPGITSAILASNILGAPLMNDFVVLSLSDLLTPRNKIVKKIKTIANSDFVCVLYNPKSTKRTTLLKYTIKKFIEARSKDTVFGLVKNAGKTDELSICGSLEHFPEQIVDMNSIVIIGNSETIMRKGKIYTKRGYKIK